MSSCCARRGAALPSSPRLPPARWPASTPTVVNVALPHIGEEFDATVSALQWVLTGYLVALASLILLGGALGDRYGRRNVFALLDWLETELEHARYDAKFDKLAQSGHPDHHLFLRVHTSGIPCQSAGTSRPPSTCQAAHRHFRPAC